MEKATFLLVGFSCAPWIFLLLKLKRLTLCMLIRKSLSVYSKSTYDSLVWLGIFDLSKLLKNIRLPIIVFWKSWPVTGHVATDYANFLLCLRLRRNHTSSIQLRARNSIVIYLSIMNITALQNCLNWRLICDMAQAKLMLCFHCRFSKLSWSADHSGTNVLKLDMKWTQSN